MAGDAGLLLRLSFSADADSHLLPVSELEALGSPLHGVPFAATSFASCHRKPFAALNSWGYRRHRWKDAYDAGVAPKVVLAATDAKALELVSMDALREHAFD